MLKSRVQAVQKLGLACGQTRSFLHNQTCFELVLCLKLAVSRTLYKIFKPSYTQASQIFSSVISDLSNVYTGSINPTTNYIKGVV